MECTVWTYTNAKRSLLANERSFVSFLSIIFFKVDQIHERKEFLNKMTALGKGKDYKTLIQTEISQRIREMEEIDRQRTQEANAAILEKLKREAPDKD